jgi:flagellar motor switch protein FliG
MTDDRALTPLPRRAGTLEPAGSAPEPHRLSGRAKAAIVVRLLLNGGTDLPLEELPEALQEKLTQQMGRMGVIDRATLAAVIGEFAQALDGIGLTFPGGIAGALSALDGRLSPATAARLRKEAGMRAGGDPWARLRVLPAAELAAMALSESTEVAAVMLSKLDTDKAAELLGHLPGPDARRIAFAVSQTETVSPQTVETIGVALAGHLDRRPERAFVAGPGQRMGDILNQSTAATRDDLLTALDETDADFASSVRRALFTFGHIPGRVATRDVARIVRAADPADLVTALAAATTGEAAATAEFLLSNMSSRLADNLREEIRDRGPVRARDGDAAMTAIIGTIRQLEQQGEITLIQIEDHDTQAP